MNIKSIVEVFGAVLTALGGYEFIKWLVGYITHRKQEKRIKGAEADKAESEAGKSAVATEDAIRDMYEETLEKISSLDEKRIAEIRAEANARIAELVKENQELHKQNLELLKAGARKDEIIEDKAKMIRELQERRVEDAKKIGELEKKVQWHECWHCKREYGKGKNDCLRREPAQNPPLKYEPIA